MSQMSHVPGLVGLLEPFPDKPRAQNVLRTDSAHVVLFEFAAGQELHEHTAHHPVLVQCLAGHVELLVGDERADLRPGDLAHLPRMVTHAVRALQDSTMTVTMLVAGTGESPDTEPGRESSGA